MQLLDSRLYFDIVDCNVMLVREDLVIMRIWIRFTPVFAFIYIAHGGGVI